MTSTPVASKKVGAALSGSGGAGSPAAPSSCTASVGGVAKPVVTSQIASDSIRSTARVPTVTSSASPGSGTVAQRVPAAAGSGGVSTCTSVRTSCSTDITRRWRVQLSPARDVDGVGVKSAVSSREPASQSSSTVASMLPAGWVGPPGPGVQSSRSWTSNHSRCTDVSALVGTSTRTSEPSSRRRWTSAE